MKCKRRRGNGRRTQEIIKVREDLLLKADKKASRLLEKRRIKYYDTLSEDEEENKMQFESVDYNPDSEFAVQKSGKGLKGGRPRKQIKPEYDNANKELGSATKNNKKRLTKKEMSQQDKTQQDSKEEEKEEKGIDNEMEEGEEESPSKEESVNKYILKKKRLRKVPAIDKEDIDDSKIISEVNIDYGKGFYP